MSRNEKVGLAVMIVAAAYMTILKDTNWWISFAIWIVGWNIFYFSGKNND